MKKKTVARMARTVNVLSGVENRLWRTIHASEKLKYPQAEDLHAAAELRRLCTLISEVREGIIHSRQTTLSI